MEAGEYNLPPASPEAVTTKISGRGDEGRVLPATPVPELGGASAPSWREWTALTVCAAATVAAFACAKNRRRHTAASGSWTVSQYSGWQRA